MKTLNLELALQNALEMAHLAAREILAFWPPKSHQIKADGSEVTGADLAAEHVIRRALQTHYPNVPILGEEHGGEAKAQAGLQWIIDPLDGTTSFALGSPVFGTLIALLEDGEPILGVAHFPVSNETTYASRGAGAWHRVGERAPVRIRVRERVALKNAFASATGAHGSDLRTREPEPRYRLSNLIQNTEKFRFVGDCLQHTLVARGRLDLALDTRMSPWDSAALIPILRESGAALACADGSADWVFGGSLISASHTELLEEAIDSIRP